jgi:hypothetical protein
VIGTDIAVAFMLTTASAILDLEPPTANPTATSKE